MQKLLCALRISKRGSHKKLLTKGWEREAVSQEQVLKMLIGLGLTRLDSEVYIFLAKKGPLKGIEITKGLKAQKQPLYRSLKNLQSKGIVTATLEHPARFTAVSFDKVVDIFIKTKMAEAQRIQENKNEILTQWQAITIGDSTDTSAKFNLIEGRGPVYAKILQMMKEAHQLSTITTVTGLLRANQFGLFDTGLTNTVKAVIRFRALTELSEENADIAKKLVKEIANAKINFEGRTPELTLNLPQLVIKNEEEILFFISPKINAGETAIEDTCLWTNCKALVQAFTAMFQEFWHNATDINAKITEIENGKPAPKTQIIADAETAKRKYYETMNAAKKEVTIVTSSIGLIETWKNKMIQEAWAQKCVPVKIMAPITTENINSAQQLSKQFEVKHIPVGYIETAIIDKEHLFQFNSLPDNKPYEPDSLFKNTFYTNNIEHVGKTRNMLNEIWEKSQALSTTKLESISRDNAPAAASSPHNPLAVTAQKIQGPIVLDNESTGKITEKEVIDKIMNPREHQIKNQPKVINYGNNAQAIIRPPSHFNLPDLLFHCFHYEKHSTYGNEDSMLIHLWLDTPAGSSFVPITFVTDNAGSVDFWRRFLAGLPAEQNVQLFNKDELQVRVHGSTFFIGWTKQISVPPFSLPPSCILIEGVGEIKAGSRTIVAPSGYRLETYYNSGDAFITFLHPTSKYSGPGTDGVFGRDVIMEFFSPREIESLKPK
jgi:HTH-type transcriptional regulator, sugar sensing transcriptional regulator